MQLWIGLFLLGIVASIFLGRIYCGWFCPINTTMSAVVWIKKKLHLENRSIPRVITKPWMRFIILGLFIAAFIFSMSSGTKILIFPFLFISGILFTVFFSEALWHCYLCPFGIILSYSASRSSHSMIINMDKCNNCGACSSICPANAIVKMEKHKIIQNKCLICMECSKNCKQNAINYK